MSDNDSKRPTITFFVVLALLVVGFFLALSKTINDQSTTDKQERTLKQNMQLGLNNLFREHVDLLATAMRNSYTNASDTKAVTRELDLNAQMVSHVVSAGNTSDLQDHFLIVWEKHTQVFITYALAIRNNNKQDLEMSLQNMHQSENELANLLSKYNPTLSKETLSALITQHDVLLQDMFTMYVAKKYEDSYRKQHEAGTEMSQLSDILIPTTP
jgi:hypothetical protein